MIPRNPKYSKIILTPEQQEEKNAILRYMEMNGISLVPYSQSGETLDIGVEGIAVMYDRDIYEIDISSNGDISDKLPSYVFDPLREYIQKYIKQIGYVYLNPFFNGLLT